MYLIWIATLLALGSCQRVGTRLAPSRLPPGELADDFNQPQSGEGVASNPDPQASIGRRNADDGKATYFPPVSPPVPQQVSPMTIVPGA